MTKTFSFLVLLNLLLLHTLMVNGRSGYLIQDDSPIKAGEYIVVIEGYDWGAAVSKVILSADGTISSVNKDEFTVEVEKSNDCDELSENVAIGERTIIYAYVSDKQGTKVDQGNKITLVLAVAPNLPIGSPIQYFRSETCRGNIWIDYKLTITNKINGNVWDKEIGQIKPLVDKFDLTGSFTHEGITLTYAFYEPKPNNSKSPLIIWLHGGGEGGTDPSIPLLANRAANYASDEIQLYFDGAYVLIPQCPERWMANGKGGSTSGEENDAYNESLMALIENYVAANPGIDSDRIYVGGCSNGAYMSLKLLLLYPDYFAAGFISSLAYRSQYITDQQIESIKNVPIWFVHSSEDGTTLPEETVLPVFKRLLEAGAKNVHLSYYDHVVDITGFFGGANYHYSGHWSWVYLHANHCKFDYDGAPVKLDGRPVTVMEWMAAQSK